MLVQPTPADHQKAAQVHRLFSAKPHSEHIASEFALAHLAAVLRTNDIGSVLEFGAGIGTITYLLLSLLGVHVEVHSTETDEFCLAVLNQNLTPEMRKRWIVHSAEDQRMMRAFDLIIIDGDIARGSDFLQPESICFVEGNRHKARASIELSLNDRELTCPLTNHVPANAKKGCWIGQVRPLLELGPAVDRDAPV